MSKAVLVLDEMPGVCADCPFDNDGECYITGEELYWNDGDNDDNSNIGNDCPLKPLPERISMKERMKKAVKGYQKDKYIHAAGVEYGWNACLDAIERRRRGCLTTRSGSTS